MKRVIISLVLLGLTVIFSVSTYSRLNSVSEKLTSQLDDIKKSADDISLSAQKLQAFSDEIEKNKSFFYTAMHHENMDDIKDSLARARARLEYNDSEDFAVEISSLKNYIEHMTELEKTDLTNIF
ncbi:MAG: DUF4363 family protein [Bacillota bacterium]|nr:DUF4363 family protein [Bacillota bacterium]